MAVHVMRRLGGIAKYLSGSRTILSSSTKSAVRLGDNSSNARTITRSLFFMSRSRDSSRGSEPTGIKSVLAPWSNACSCGCSMHTKGDKELVAFLEEEINNESRAHKSLVVPELGDFLCKYEGAEVTLTREFNNETVVIKTNVNHSVDTEESASVDPSEAKEESDVMKAKPDFNVQITKGKKTLSFECSFCSPNDFEDEREETYNDAFQITEISMHSGEYLNETYSVSGDIMDGYLYDLLMNYLEERGLSNEFADKFVSLLTSYEHKLYINLLQNMKHFVEK